MDAVRQLEAIRELLLRLEVEVREERLGGESGGLCVVRGRRVLFIDLDADPAVRLERSLGALRTLPDIEDIYLSPALRELIDRGVEEGREH